MSEFFKAELKDKFLEYASERDDYFQLHLLYDEFLKPNYSLQFVEKLVYEIMEYDSALLDIMSGNGSKIFMLSATALTKDFLDESGFKNLYIQEEEKWDVFLTQLADNRKLSFSSKVTPGNTVKTENKKERFLLLSLLSAVILSFVFTLFSLLKPFFRNDDYVSREEFQRVIFEMERKIKENDVMPNDLFLQSKPTEIKKDSIN
ncbi:hypothetical protein MTsPCn5_27910 [Croceitalea sp. MTPC5]|uniref:hypothetical protein n=1 Tax=Croceitalea sp. MTPC5 TaxID=3056565 RepID=UPI002B3FA99E|nr:hypothetical protein MTsPCn5_27910 [Croceitalea sp. MTPC5]